MTREPFIAHSELTNEIYIVVGKEKYRVTEQAIKAVMAIKALEQPIRKVSKWIPIWDKDHIVIYTYQCPECGIMMNVNTSHYCPGCGAKMESEE